MASTINTDHSKDRKPCAAEGGLCGQGKSAACPSCRALFRPIVGGTVGTVAITLMMYCVAPIMTGARMDIAQLLGSMLGGNWWAGMAMHLMLGTIVFPLVYWLVLYHSLPGRPTTKGIEWGALLWLVAQGLVMPMMGAGFFSIHSGGLMAAMGSLVGHVVYGALLGSIAGSAK